tara:strand:+ start:575 stop:778 length:204 start_codon:yes stop_codon:yes gene_type:complete
MNAVFKDINSKPLALKKTDYIFSHSISFHNILRVNDFYIENNKKFVWLSHWKGNVFIFGNPFPSYNF